MCGKSATLACQHCRVTFYCGKEHQSVDWFGIHEKICQLLGGTSFISAGLFAYCCVVLLCVTISISFAGRLLYHLIRACVLSRCDILRIHLCIQALCPARNERHTQTHAHGQKQQQHCVMSPFRSPAGCFIISSHQSAHAVAL
jgi:hypothetical protein